MKLRNALTDRQELFAQHFALTGNGTMAAIRSGCPRRSAHTRAYKWVRKGEVQARIEELREEVFLELRHAISKTLHRSVMMGLSNGLRYSETRRGIALLKRLKVYEHTDRVIREIEKIERRFGCSFEIIMGALAEIEYEDEDDHDLIQACKAIREANRDNPSMVPVG